MPSTGIDYGVLHNEIMQKLQPHIYDFYTDSHSLVLVTQRHLLALFVFVCTDAMTVQHENMSRF